GLLENVFQADDAEELGTYFHFYFKLQVPMEYLLYGIERFKAHYGEFQYARAIAVDIDVYNYHSVMENGNITGIIGLANNNLINQFFIGCGPFLESYLSSFTLNNITDEFIDFPDGGNKSLLITRDEIVMCNSTTGEKQAVGSTFKLYVLKALREKITTDPQVNWTTEIPILDKLKSLPSGVMHTWANGTMVSLETLANYMMEISDNTATDHLIQFLNRSYIESFLPLDYSIPLLKTADMFKLRYLVNNTDLTTYLAMDPTAKRTYLDDIVYELDIDDIPLLFLDPWENIAMEKEVEWYFTTTQVAQVINDVKDLNATRRSLGCALVNQWEAVAYKGGSNVGVLSLAHAVQAKNGTWYTVIMFINNYIKPALDYSLVNFDIDFQILCAKLLMFLAAQ
ncbi:MAG: serine hydrolase, partial [Promethearchaeota archaeon]